MLESLYLRRLEAKQSRPILALGAKVEDKSTGFGQFMPSY